MLQRTYRGEDAAGAITTATDTLDAAIEDAQTQRDALQAQYDALQQQISDLWGQADVIASQMYELDQAIGDAAGEIGSSGVTVQVYSRDRSRRRAEGDTDQLNTEWDELNQRTNGNYDKFNSICKKWGVEDLEALEKKRDEIGEDYDRAEELENSVIEDEERMDEISDELRELGDL